VSPNSLDAFSTLFPHCCRILGESTWGRVRAALDPQTAPRDFADALEPLMHALSLPLFICDLARIEWAREAVSRTSQSEKSPPEEASLTVNPSLSLIPVEWQGLPELMDSQTKTLKPGSGHVLVWKTTQTGKINVRHAREADLLALKIVIEEIDPRQAAEAGSVPVASIHATLCQAVEEGLLISCGSRIERQGMAADKPLSEKFTHAQVFTLQWHITQACDLHCKHCYDRSDRTALTLETALTILDDFYSFCRRMGVHGQVTFSGGNPLLYPRFDDLYRTAVECGFTVAILGNPAPRSKMEAIVAIARPAFFQISLEGLANHNDHIRGHGHFQRSLHFLDLLRELGIYSMVMLTLTRDNLDQVIPLGVLLKERTDTFTFNRLATVGEGASLSMPDPRDYKRFLKAYLEAASDNPVLSLKDNLFNIFHHERGRPLFGGCTGYGCGAAFNFVSLLSDGEVHACRKFPSPIGKMPQSSLMEIYHSDLARQYRSGSLACRSCRLRLVCRGCLAITHSFGRDIFQDLDPYCFATDHVINRQCVFPNDVGK
jgi:selenobiotic family peptide radical SAM maturase